MWRCALAGLMLGGEHTILSSATLCLWENKRATEGTPDCTKRILVGVAEKEFVVYLGTLCQKGLRRAIVPVVGVKRSAP